jgi:hypothetical protein
MLPAATQTGAPVLHAVTLFWQDPASLQSAPTAQATHSPALQTPPSPQIAPFTS